MPINALYQQCMLNNRKARRSLATANKRLSELKHHKPTVVPMFLRAQAQ